MKIITLSIFIILFSDYSYSQNVSKFDTVKQQNIHSEMRKKYNFKNLSKKQTKEILTKYNGVYNQDIENKIGKSIFSKPYLLSDGRILLYSIFDSTAALYESIEHLMSVVETSKKLSQKSSQHMLTGLLPYGSDFPLHVDELINKLSQQLSIPIDSLDRSNKSMEILDKKFKEMESSEFIYQNYFAMIVAYAGEVMIKTTPGSYWKMTYNEKDSLWEPYIITSNQTKFNPWRELYVEINENPNNPCLSCALAGELHKYGLMK